MILLGALPCNLSRDQLAMESLIIVILVDIQIHLVRRWELRGVELVVQVVVIVILLLVV